MVALWSYAHVEEINCEYVPNGRHGPALAASWRLERSNCRVVMVVSRQSRRRVALASLLLHEPKRSPLRGLCFYFPRTSGKQVDKMWPDAIALSEW